MQATANEYELLSPRDRALREVLGLIRSGTVQAGEAIPAERKIADRLRISRTPVKAALEELHARGILQRSKGRGYVVPATTQSVDTSATQPSLSTTIALLSTVSPRYWAAYLGADRVEFDIMRFSDAHGLNLLRVVDGEAHPLILLEQLRPKGVLVEHEAAARPDYLEGLRRLADEGLPIVAHGDDPALQTFDRVVCDQESGQYELTQHLIKLGRQRILCIYDVDDSRYWIQARQRGHRRALQEAGLHEILPLFCPDMPKKDVSSLGWREVQARFMAALMVAHLQGDRPIDALLVTSDGGCETAALACGILGKEPGRDILIGGFDNLWPQMHAFGWVQHRPVATVDVQQEEVARNMVSLLLDRAAGQLPAQPQNIVIPSRLVIFDS